MRLPGPRSLRDQTLVVLVLVLLLSHLIGVSIYSADRRTALELDGALDVAERTVGIVELLERLPDTWRDDILLGTNSRTFQVTLGSAPAAIDTGGTEPDELSEVRGYLHEHLPQLTPSDVLIRTLDPDAATWLAHTPRVERLLQVSVGVADDEWLTSTGIIGLTEAPWPRPAGLYLATMLVGMAVAGIWMVYRVTSPLTTFARAADQLGKDLRSEPIPEAGPEEVVKAARAFNEMQSRLQRMVENRTQMLAAISHDLRTPITTLGLRAELMPGGPDRDKLLETLQEIEYMLASVLDFSRATFQEEPNRVVDVAALVGSLCDDIAETGAQVRLEAPARALYRCRRVALKRAIANLIDNAVRYGGEAEVTLADRPGDVVIEIADRGPGLPTGCVEQLFVPFFRAEGSRSQQTGGSGLGLGIAKAIVESHGGTLDIRNRPEGGAMAVIRLPR